MNDKTKHKAIPSRDDILAFIARERAGGNLSKIGKREIAREFGVKGSDKIDLKRILRELEDEGAVERRGDALLGRFVDVRIVRALPNSLRGELVASHPEAA